jgi:predicted O-methyltransferase YrrM
MPAAKHSEFASYYAGKAFTTNWTSNHLKNWSKILASHRYKPLKILEIGSWEGRSALFFLNYLPNASLVCIDTFKGGREHAKDPGLNAIEKRFDANLAPFGDRVEKRKGASIEVLGELGLTRRQFDVVYVDGSHLAVDVYRDAVLSWPLLVPGGTMIFDDYQWRLELPAAQRPKEAIDSFLQLINGEYHEVHRDYQIVLSKAARRRGVSMREALRHLRSQMQNMGRKIAGPEETRPYPSRSGN